MRIAIDARLLTAQPTGIGHYVRHLVRELPPLSPGDEFVLVSPRKIHMGGSVSHSASANGQPNLRVSRLRFPKARLWESALLPWALLTGGAQLFHSTSMSAGPRPRSIPVVATIHDLAFRTHPSFVRDDVRRYLERHVPPLLERCRQVLAISHHTKRRLIEEYGVDPAKIVVSPLAPALPPASNAGRHPSIPHRYLLFVGAIEPRKNLACLLRTVHSLRSQGEEVRLEIAGPIGWQEEEFFHLRRALGVEPFVTVREYVAQEDLAALYHHAEMLLLPSWEEGFGLPALEAMAAGCPVIASDLGALPEVVGEAGVLLPPDDQEAWTRAVGEVWGSPAIRDRLSAAGRIRAGWFTWRRTAEITLRAYRDALGEEP